jgi:hypothetical protein
VELGGAAQGLAGTDATGTFLGVMHDDDGDGVASLQLTQIAIKSQSGDACDRR